MITLRKSPRGNWDMPSLMKSQRTLLKFIWTLFSCLHCMFFRMWCWPPFSWELGVHSSVCGGSPFLKELINCLSWFSHLEIKRLMEILWNHELEFMQLHYSLKLELLTVTVFVLCFFPGASITLKTIPGIETVCLHNNKVSAWREKHAVEARISKAKYVSIYMKTHSTQGWPQHRRIRSPLTWQRTRCCKTNQSQQPRQELGTRKGHDGSHHQGSMNEEKTEGEHSEFQEKERWSERTQTIKNPQAWTALGPLTALKAAFEFVWLLLPGHKRIPSISLLPFSKANPVLCTNVGIYWTLNLRPIQPPFDVAPPVSPPTPDI